jgi:hypothetical protein
MTNPLEFQFTVKDDYDEKDLRELWSQTQKIQKQWDRFLTGHCSETDFCDLLSDFSIDPDEIALIYENNLKVLGFV